MKISFISKREKQTETVDVKSFEVEAFEKGVSRTHFVEITDKKTTVGEGGEIWHKYTITYDSKIDLYYLGKQVQIFQELENKT